MTTDGHWPTFGDDIAVVSIKGEISDSSLARIGQPIPGTDISVTAATSIRALPPSVMWAKDKT